MVGPIASFADGYNSFTAAAKTCAATVCRIISRPSSESIVIIETSALSGNGSNKSFCEPFIHAATALLARFFPISFARSNALAPSGSCLEEPSGNLISITYYILILQFN